MRGSPPQGGRSRISGEANIELARRTFERFRGEDAEGLMALVAPDVEVHVPATLANAGTFQGHDGFLTWVTRWLDAWEDYEMEIRGPMKAVGRRHVVSAVHQSATGKGSGVPVEMELAYLTEFSDEKLRALHLYPTVEEAERIATEREQS